MTLKDQFGKLKENWLIIVLLIVGFIFLNGGGMLFSSMSSSMDLSDSYYSQVAMEASARGYYPSTGSDFAPEETERLITKNAQLNSQVERGNFNSADSQLRTIVTSTDSYLLKADVRENGDGSTTYSTGYYSLKVESAKYDAVVSQLKNIADVTYFTESQVDITARSYNLQIELDAAQNMLNRYTELYEDSSFSSKTNLISQIAEQERKIAYLEEQLENEAQKVSYSTITVNLNEERPTFWRVKMVEFMDLLKTLVNSFNSLLYLIFAALPYVVFFAIIRFIYGFFKKRRSE